MNASSFGFAYAHDRRNFNGYRDVNGIFSLYSSALAGGRDRYKPTHWPETCANEKLPSAVADDLTPRSNEINGSYFINAMKAFEHAVNYLYLYRMTNEQNSYRSSLSDQDSLMKRLQ